VEVAAVRMDTLFWLERFVGAVVTLHTLKNYLDGVAGLPSWSASLLQLARWCGDAADLYGGLFLA
jgi:hypothetical protein